MGATCGRRCLDLERPADKHEESRCQDCVKALWSTNTQLANGRLANYRKAFDYSKGCERTDLRTKQIERFHNDTPLEFRDGPDPANHGTNGSANPFLIRTTGSKAVDCLADPLTLLFLLLGRLAYR